jgi:small subunit ribosomal protein S5
MTEKVKPINKETWEPRTAIGKKVKSGEVTSIDEILENGRRILESEITDVLIPEMESETLEIKTTQRVTDSGKRTRFRVVTVVGDKKGHVGIGVGKCDDLKPAIDSAITDAKKNMISVRMGCGSWECRCKFTHSVPMKTQGKEGSTIITLKPAPRGLGLAANEVVKKVLSMAGIKDSWSSMTGGRNVYNMAIATIKALDSINIMKPPA